MKIDDQKLKRFLAGTKRARPMGKCPDDEELTNFVEGVLEGQRLDSVLAHLARCGVCAHTVLSVRQLLAEAEKEERERVPLSALSRARKLDPAGKGVMEVVIQFAKGVAEVIRTSGQVVGGLAPADALRGEGRVVSENLVTLTKDFPPYFAEVDVEKTRQGRAEISVKLTETMGGRPASGVRVSLYDPEEEKESAMLDGGTAVFENLEFGQYKIEITRVGEPVGRITLEMKGDGK